MFKILLYSFLSDFKWFRKMIGGYWEYWYMNVPVEKFVWIHSEKKLEGNPSYLCIGTPIIEDYTL